MQFTNNKTQLKEEEDENGKTQFNTIFSLMAFFESPTNTSKAFRS